jgi:hypothetical protein
MNNATTERINALVTGLQRKCGTYAAYVMGCRCDECRSASSRYQREAAKRKANGDFRGVVSADRARAHILALSAAGVGKVIVADEARVNRNIIHAIRVGHIRSPYGKYGFPRGFLVASGGTAMDACECDTCTAVRERKEMAVAA